MLVYLLTFFPINHKKTQVEGFEDFCFRLFQNTPVDGGVNITMIFNKDNFYDLYNTPCLSQTHLIGQPHAYVNFNPVFYNHKTHVQTKAHHNGLHPPLYIRTFERGAQRSTLACGTGAAAAVAAALGIPKEISGIVPVYCPGGVHWVTCQSERWFISAYPREHDNADLLNCSSELIASDSEDECISAQA